MAIMKYIASIIIWPILVIGLLMLGGCDDTPKPKLAIMTSLPLIFGEASVEQVVRGENQPAPIYEILKDNYDVTPLDNIDSRLEQFDTLLLAQVRALTAQEFVDLDKWVRSGGKVVILSDAALQWHSDYSLGDKRRPLFTSLLSPLFAYWGIEQILLIEDPEEQVITVDGYDINTVTPGEWVIGDNDSGDIMCQLSDNSFEADCNVGQGRAILIADSDFIHEELWQGFGISHNITYLLNRLEAINRQP